MTRSWLLFACSLVLALSVAFGWGWISHQRVAPAPSQWLSPGETLRFRGLEFSDVAVTTVDPTPELAESLPDGAKVAMLRITVAVVDEPADENGHLCNFDLVTLEGTYPDDKQFAIADGLPYGCDADAEGEPLSVGQRQTITAGWAVPSAPGDDAHVLIRFPVGPESLGVRW